MAKRPQDSEDEKESGSNAFDLLAVLAGVVTGTSDRFGKLFHRVRAATSQLPGEESHIFRAVSEQQRSEYETYRYMTTHSIHVSGIVQRSKNIVKLNSREICIPDSPFLLLMRLARRLKSDPSGWLHAQDLLKKSVSSHQPISRLRKSLEINMDEAKKLIESDEGGGRYRISTHPDFVVCDKEKLLQHQDPAVREIASGLP